MNWRKIYEGGSRNYRERGRAWESERLMRDRSRERWEERQEKKILNDLGRRVEIMEKRERIGQKGRGKGSSREKSKERKRCLKTS